MLTALRLAAVPRFPISSASRRGSSVGASGGRVEGLRRSNCVVLVWDSERAKASAERVGRGSVGKDMTLGGIVCVCV